MSEKPDVKPKLTAEELRMKANYKTGFCGNGFCEGTRPKSPSGLPMKVCVAIEICNCDCHSKITKMYQITGTDRVIQQNPDYVPYVGPDLSWIQDERIPPAPFVPPQPFTPRTVEEGVAANVATGDGPRPDRHNRLRGWLENEVKDICDRYMVGEISESLTPKAVGLWIDKENPPSAGAVGAVFERWSKMGFAQINKHPVRFVSYTVKGMTLGYERMKSDYQHNNKRSNS